MCLRHLKIFVKKEEQALEEKEIERPRSAIQTNTCWSSTWYSSHGWTKLKKERKGKYVPELEEEESPLTHNYHGGGQLEFLNLEFCLEEAIESLIYLSLVFVIRLFVASIQSSSYLRL